MKRILLIVLSLVFHSAYADSIANTGQSTSTKREFLSSFQFYVSELADQLFDTSQRFASNDLVAVGSFLPVDDLKGEQVPASEKFGLQLQESFITLTAQHGLGVVEYKAMTKLSMGQRFDVMLSRDLKRIRDEFAVNYFLTGTYTVREDGYLVNARLIDVKTHTVVAAATDLVPEKMEQRAISASGRATNSPYFIR